MESGGLPTPGEGNTLNLGYRIGGSKATVGWPPAVLTSSACGTPTEPLPPRLTGGGKGDRDEPDDPATDQLRRLSPAGSGG
jgi:hypothetical protein